MRDLNQLNHLRLRDVEIAFAGRPGDSGNGCFQVFSPVDRQMMRVIASDGDSWDHVSISRQDRCPTWEELEYVKRLCFKDNETAVQFHVPPSDHRSLHPFCLHLWRHQRLDFPRPPADMVA